MEGAFLELVWNWLQAEINVSYALWVTGHPVLIPSLNKCLISEWPSFTCSHSNRKPHFSSSCSTSFSSAKTANQVKESIWLFKSWAGWSPVCWAVPDPTDTDMDLAIFRISPPFTFCHTSSLFTAHWFCSQKGSHSVHP